jgi:hypothetical protein
VPQGALDEPGMHTSFAPRRGGGMPEGRDGHAGFGDPGTVCGFTAGALDTGATQGRESRRTLLVIAPGSRKEPSRMTMGFPGGAEPREGRFGQGDVAVFGALAAVDMDLEARAIQVRDLEGEGFREPQSQARDGGKGDLVVEGGGGREEPSDFLNAEHSGETVGGVRAQEREGVPVALEDVLGEEADATIAAAHGRGGEAIDVCAVQAIALEFLCRDAVG